MICCEKCHKEFHRDFALQMHLMTGKKHKSECYQYYIDEYKHESDFPTRKYSKTKLGINHIQCECCSRRFKNLTMHLNRYSPDCYRYYIDKYGDEDNFPMRTINNKGQCLDCGSKTSHYSIKYCSKCYIKYLPQKTDMKLIELIRKKVKETTSDPVYRKNLSKKVKESFRKNPKLAENQRKYMLEGGAIKALLGNKNPSKPQIEFFGLVCDIRDDSVMNHPIWELNILLDIAIPSLKLNLEYDGSYWHQNKELDDIRDMNLTKMGWVIYRFIDRIPSLKELSEIIKRTEYDRRHQKIGL